MRVLVAVDSLAGLTSQRAGTAVARAFAACSAQVAVVPMGDAGSGAAQALADIIGAVPVLLPQPATAHPLGGPGREGRHDPHVDAAASGVAPVVATVARAGDRAVVLVAPTGHQPLDFGGSSWLPGLVVASVLGQEPGLRTLWLDPGTTSWHDGGAGFLAALGAAGDRPLDQGVAGLGGVSRVSLERPRTALGDCTLVLLTEDAAPSLTGLRGITSVLGHGRGDDVATLLTTDQSLVDLSTSLGVGGTDAGTGSSGGLGAAVMALGGSVSTGPEACAGATGLRRSIAQADLVVTGCDVLDFGRWGGGVVRGVASLAEECQRPVIAVARRNFVSARELRRFGIEEAHSLADADHVVPTEDDLTAATAPIAAGWTRA